MYIELHTSSAFSFLDGASLPETLIDQAAALDYPALALLDRMVCMVHLGFTKPLLLPGSSRSSEPSSPSGPTGTARDHTLRRVSPCYGVCPCSSKRRRDIAISVGLSPG